MNDKKSPLGLSKDQVNEEAVRRITKEVVKHTLITLGIDACDPQEMQRDSQFVRDLRLTSEKIKSRGLIVIVGIVVVGVATACWLGLKQLISQ